ncbi:DUF1161 domain-containing protein [Solimonas sp. K1W22B-7]|uniref:DUF1161 domain-containing protein n=1 Tax=Solimonas sp. K1W22B-7 TaxID=2303331 RepID=UPI000E3311F1|nr:DUF1161 domain-containing protein [Solimonas sp. K1W22B-7]AXQ27747.1 DUF1161 domain-containing protein [Solimonas sp. K1W22B-7]
MRHILLGAILAAMATPALSTKACEELGAEISAKIESKGIRSYSLKLVPAAQVGEQTVVGSCESGAMKLVYRRR